MHAPNWECQEAKNKMDTGSGSQNGSNTLEILIEQRLQRVVPSSDSCYIYRVPERIRSLNSRVYEPQFVSIGPLHHGRETLRDMEEHKYRYLKDFLTRTNKQLPFYTEIIRTREETLRDSYEEVVEFNSDDFVKIILLDSVFILELLYKCHLMAKEGAIADRITVAPKMDYIISDLLLLENQLPFFILEAVYEAGRIFETESLVRLYFDLFYVTLNDVGVDYDQKFSDNGGSGGQHFLDMARSLCIRGTAFEPSAPIRNPAAPLVPSITELHQSGVKFKLKQRSKRINMFSIHFDKDVLEIPWIRISERSERILKNLAVYEQCHNLGKVISDYLEMLDGFVNSPKDVELLIENGILKNEFSDSHEACCVINNLRKGIYVNEENFTYDHLSEELNIHCRKTWNKWKASLRQAYVKTPWAVVSLFVATLLFLLATVQTVGTLLSLRSIS